MEADISRIELEVSSAAAERSCRLPRTFWIELSISRSETRVASVDVTCPSVFAARARLFEATSFETERISWLKRR